jgi:hypothetical protein
MQSIIIRRNNHRRGVASEKPLNGCSGSWPTFQRNSIASINDSLALSIAFS